MRKSTLDKLRSYRTKLGKTEGHNLECGKSRNPLPQIPEQTYLENSWLPTTLRSNPQLGNEPQELVVMMRERRG